MSLSERLSSLSGKEDQTSPKRDDTQDGSQLVQRCVIIQRDEKGYGLTVSGDNPVFVQSVKQDGAAARAGVQQNDRIIKVNGTLVTQRNHIDVVKLIKSGSYVALTLLGKPPPTTASSAVPRHTSFSDSRGRVTAPQPVDPVKDLELRQQKWHTMQAMYEQAKEDHEKMQRTYVKNPSEKLHAQLIEKEKQVKTLENQLKNWTVSEPGTPGPLVSTVTQPFPDIEHSPMDPSTAPSWRQLHRAGGSRHIKQASAPVSLYKAGAVKGRTTQVARSKSDVTSRRHASFTAVSSHSSHFIGSGNHGNLGRELLTEAVSVSGVPDPCSLSDSPHTSPSISPTPVHPGNSHDVDETSGSSKVDSGNEEGVIPAIQPNIIAIDDEEFADEEEQQTSDPGPFVSIAALEKKPAHLAIFLHYLISNSDPSSLFFHIVSDVYSHAQGNVKELRKWAYEISSTFLVQNAPLKVSVDEAIITTIDNALTVSSSENNLRAVFDQAQNAVKSEIEELLIDFRSKKDLGLGNIYGAHELQENMDKAKEYKTIEKYLLPHLERCSKEHVKSDREQATGWALATFLRHVGMTKTTQMERVQSFVMKDKKGLKFPGSKSGKPKLHKGHQFTPQHYYTATFCTHCSGLIWGVGYQGYQCQTCEMNVHKQCVEDVGELCAGKHKKSDRRVFRPSSFIPVIPMTTRKQSNPNKEAGGHSSAVQDALREAATSEGKPELNITTQPLRSDETDLAGLPRGHSVKSIVERYEYDGPQSPPGDQMDNAGQPMKDRDLGRSESMKGRGEKGDRPARRAKSDVDIDDAFKALNQSGSSSTSSLSNRSLESPSNSSETVNDLLAADSDLDVETELPHLKHVIGEDCIKKLKPKEKKRQEVINELFHTERAHVRNLKILERLFNRPMLNDGGVMHDLAKALFPNMDQMIELHSSLNNEMKQRRKENKVVTFVGDILLRRFDGDEGEIFRQACAEYCRNQVFALEALKKQQRKEQRLSQFLNEAESNRLCRRLQLKDLIPSQMQRLTKYPLLIDNLTKYTQRDSKEYHNLEKARHCSKINLAYVNQAVKECENCHRLKDLQRRLDKRPIENSTDPAVEFMKKLDLTQHKLVYDGDLTWRLRSHRQIDLHVVLLEDILVLLQKQDEKLVLCQSNVQSSRGEDKEKYNYTHSPVLKLQNLLARNVAIDKKAFFVVNTSATGPQIYEFVAVSQEERKKWCKYINDLVEEQRAGHKNKTPFSSHDIRLQGEITTPQPVEIALLRDRITREPREPRTETPPPESVSPSHHKLQTADMCQISEPHLIQPDEVNVSGAVMAQAEQVFTPLEKLRRNEEKIQLALEERELIVSEMMDMSGGQSRIVHHRLSQAESDESEDQDPQCLLVKAINEINQLTHLINISCNALATTMPDSAPHSGAAKGDTQQVTLPIPMEQLRDMATRMNQILTNLLSAINTREDERESLREEVRQAQEKLNKLREIQRASMGMPLTPQSRPTSLISVASSISEVEEGTETEGEQPETQSVDEVAASLQAQAKEMMADAVLLEQIGGMKDGDSKGDMLDPIGTGKNGDSTSDVLNQMGTGVDGDIEAAETDEMEEDNDRTSLIPNTKETIATNQVKSNNDSQAVDDTTYKDSDSDSDSDSDIAYEEIPEFVNSVVVTENNNIADSESGWSQAVTEEFSKQESDTLKVRSVLSTEINHGDLPQMTTDLDAGANEGDEGIIPVHKMDDPTESDTESGLRAEGVIEPPANKDSDCERTNDVDSEIDADHTGPIEI